MSMIYKCDVCGGTSGDNYYLNTISETRLYEDKPDDVLWDALKEKIQLDTWDDICDECLEELVDSYRKESKKQREEVAKNIVDNFVSRHSLEKLRK